MKVHGSVQMRQGQALQSQAKVVWRLLQAYLEVTMRVAPTIKARILQKKAIRAPRDRRRLPACCNRLPLCLKVPAGHFAPTSSDLYIDRYMNLRSSIGWCGMDKQRLYLKSSWDMRDNKRLMLPEI